MEPTQEAAPSSTALLDALRKRLMPEVNAGAAQRLSDVGIGMMTSTSPDFLSALGKGLQAGNTAETSRIQMLRQAAETEEQSQYRKAQIELERAKQTYDQDPTNPRNRAALMQAEASMISAGAAATRAGRENQGVFVPIGTATENGVSGVVSQNNVTGQTRFAPGVTPNSLGSFMARQEGRTDTNWERARSSAQRDAAALGFNFTTLPQQEQINWLDARTRHHFSRLPSQAGAPAPAQQEAPTQQRVQLPLVGSAPRRAPTE